MSIEKGGREIYIYIIARPSIIIASGNSHCDCDEHGCIQTISSAAAASAVAAPSRLNPLAVAIPAAGPRADRLVVQCCVVVRGLLPSYKYIHKVKLQRLFLHPLIRLIDRRITFSSQQNSSIRPALLTQQENARRVHPISLFVASIKPCSVSGSEHTL